MIAKGGKPGARLAPRSKPREPGALKGKIRIAKDFDAPPDELLDLFEGKDERKSRRRTGKR